MKKGGEEKNIRALPSYDFTQCFTCNPVLLFFPILRKRIPQPATIPLGESRNLAKTLATPTCSILCKKILPEPRKIA